MESARLHRWRQEIGHTEWTESLSFFNGAQLEALKIVNRYLRSLIERGQLCKRLPLRHVEDVRLLHGTVGDYHLYREDTPFPLPKRVDKFEGKRECSCNGLEGAISHEHLFRCIKTYKRWLDAPCFTKCREEFKKQQFVLKTPFGYPETYTSLLNSQNYLNPWKYRPRFSFTIRHHAYSPRKVTVAEETYRITIYALVGGEPPFIVTASFLEHVTHLLWHLRDVLIVHLVMSYTGLEWLEECLLQPKSLMENRQTTVALEKPLFNVCYLKLRAYYNSFMLQADKQHHKIKPCVDALLRFGKHTLFAGVYYGCYLVFSLDSDDTLDRLRMEGLLRRVCKQLLQLYMDSVESPPSLRFLRVSITNTHQSGNSFTCHQFITHATSGSKFLLVRNHGSFTLSFYDSLADLCMTPCENHCPGLWTCDHCGRNDPREGNCCWKAKVSNPQCDKNKCYYGYFCPKSDGWIFFDG